MHLELLGKMRLIKLGGVEPWMDGDISVKLKKMGCKIKFEPAEFARS